MKLLQEEFTPEFPRPAWNFVFFFQCVCVFGCCYKPVCCFNTNRKAANSNTNSKGLHLKRHDEKPVACFVALSKWTKDMICLDTLPKTNIAMENPPFWWYLQGNMGIFMGYVSFREGTSWKIKMFNTNNGGRWFKWFSFSNAGDFQVPKAVFEFSRDVSMGLPKACPSLKWWKRTDTLSKCFSLFPPKKLYALA